MIKNPVGKIKGKVSGSLSAPLNKAGSVSGDGVISGVKGSVSGAYDSAKGAVDGFLHPEKPDLPAFGSKSIKGNEPPSEPKALGTAFDIGNFISNSALDKGLHYQHNFVVYIDQPKGFKHDIDPKDLIINALEISVPGVVLGVDVLKINGRPRFFANERAEQDLKITFIEDKDFSARRFFEEWMSVIFNPFDKGRNYPDDFKAPFIKIHTTDQNGESSFADTFMDVFPYDISDSNYSVSTYGISRTSVTFKYKVHILEGPQDADSITSKVNLF